MLFVVLLLTALLTAFYMTRAVLMTFFGEFRGHGEPHEAPRTHDRRARGPRLRDGVRGARSGSPQLGAVFGKWVFFEELEEALFVPWVAVPVHARRRLRDRRSATPCTATTSERDPLRSLGGAYTLVSNKFYLDDIYWKGIVRPDPRRRLARASTGTTGTSSTEWSTAPPHSPRPSRAAIAWFDLKVIDGAVNGLANIAGFTGGLLRYIQSGNVQRYAVFLFAGVVVLAIIFTRI